MAKTERETKPGRATLRYLRSSPQKVRLVVDQLRGKPVAEALSILKFSPRVVAKDLSKVLKSAVANAEQQELGGMEDLVVAEAFVDGGPSFKRIRPAPMGRAYRYLHRTSHVTFRVEGLPEEKLAKRTKARAAQAQRQKSDRSPQKAEKPSRKAKAKS